MFERSDFANLRHRKLSKIAGKVFSFFHKPEPFDTNPDFKFRRENYISLINNNIDVVLCVSQRVKNIAVKMGVAPAKCMVQYIGTKHADYASDFPNIVSHNGTITVGYLGYMRRDKGFYFLLDTLEKMPPKLADSMHIVIAAPITDKSAYQRLIKLKSKFQSVKIFNVGIKFVISFVRNYNNRMLRICLNLRFKFKDFLVRNLFTVFNSEFQE